MLRALVRARYVLLCLAALVGNTQVVKGDHPLQTILSRLECYKFTQEGCDTDFTVAHPELSRSADNTSVAATRFYMFTPDNPDDPELMHKCGGGLPPGTKFNPACKTEIFIPGFFSGVCHFAIYRELKNERLKCGCYNVILIEWTWGNSFDVILGVENMKIVGKQVAVVIRGLKEMYGLTDEDFICTGHSLGAQGCAFVGQAEPIAVINGLDPAGAAFWEDMPLDERLDPGDATRCVQVTHCNGGQCLPKYLGVNFTCGTKDIWYNDGLHQPACYKQALISFLTGDFVYGLASLAIPPLCSHLQCLQYYKTSICTHGCNQIAVECDSAKSFLSGQCRDCGGNGGNCDVAGEYSCDCDNGSFKSYYLKTDINCPYCDNSGINVNGYSCPALKKKRCSRKFKN